MMSRDASKRISGFLCLAIIVGIVLCRVEVSAKVYPLMLTELEEQLTGWLIHDGFEVRRTLLKMGQVKLKAVRAEENLEILLKPHSPLATDVRARYTTGIQLDQAGLQRLWDHISAYVSGPSYDVDDSSQTIPTAVLSQIESVVCINAKAKGERIQFSGFIVDKSGLILCTAHIPEAFQSFTVVLYDGQEVKGRLLEMDTHRDLALLKVDSKFDTFISLSKGRNLVGMGERLYSIGCPISLRGSVYSGIINGPPRRLNDQPLWQIDMKIHPGSSGSPVLDVQGNLVAIVKGRFRGTDTVGFLIPLETIVAFAKDSKIQ